MNIAILGTRGIPNNYGGFEQFAEILSVGLVKRGHTVSVYNPHFHPYKLSEYQGVKIINKWHPEPMLGSPANFIFDYLCLRHAFYQKFDIYFELGYSTVIPCLFLLNVKNKPVVFNMDGLEWKRTKFSASTQKFMRWLEKVAAQKIQYMVSDNGGIRDYFLKTYQKDSVVIPYGANVFNEPTESILQHYQVEPYRYSMLIARLEPENNIEMILEGYKLSQDTEPFIVIGNHQTAYGQVLKNMFQDVSGIRFIGGLYNLPHLNNLRYFCKLYFHGHSVGGTNPSLVEAMGSGALIAAHQNPFNAAVLAENAFYFSTSDDVSNLLSRYQEILKNRTAFVLANQEQVKKVYSWETIIDQYEFFFKQIVEKKIYS